MEPTLPDLLSDCGVEIQTSGHHARHGWIQVDCPWCGPETGKFHLGYSLESGFFNCWKCGYHPTLSTLIELTHLPVSQLKPFIKWRSDLEGSYERRPRTGLKLPPLLLPLSTKHRKYLRHRGFDPNELERLWGLQGIGPVPFELAWRIFIPIVVHGETVSWTTRSTTNESLRYRSASPNEEAVDHKTLLYGQDFCQNAAVIHEGPTDVWRTGPGAIALFGMKVSKPQLLKLSEYAVRVVCFDGTRDAQEQAVRLVNDLNVFPGETIRVVLDSGKDAASASEKEVRRLRRFLCGG